MAIQISGAKVGTLVGPTSISLNDLTDVLIANPLDGQYLRYNQGTLDWGNATLPLVSAETLTGVTLAANVVNSSLANAGPSFTVADTIWANAGPGNGGIHLTTGGVGYGGHLGFDSDGGVRQGYLTSASTEALDSGSIVYYAPAGHGFTGGINSTGQISSGIVGSGTGRVALQPGDAPAQSGYVSFISASNTAQGWINSPTDAPGGSGALVYFAGGGHQFHGRIISNGDIRTDGALMWINGTPGFNRSLVYMSNGVSRWQATVNGEAETGGSAGSNYVILRHDDVGGFLGEALNINRATGSVFIPGAITANSTLAVGNTITAGYTITSGSHLQAGFAPNGSVRVVPGSTGSTGYVDFVAANNVRQGYIGNSLSVGAVDTGLLSYVGGQHNFYGLVYGTSGITSNGRVVLEAGGINIQNANAHAQPAIQWNPALSTAGIVLTGFTDVGGGFRDISVLDAGAIGTSAFYQIQYNTGAGFAEHVWTIGGQLFRMNSSGAGYSPAGWQAVSDARVKDNLAVIPDALTKVGLLSGYTYNRNDLPNNPRMAGYIAQDIQSVLPESVSTVHLENNVQRFAVDHNAVIGLMINAIKELKAEVDSLRAQLNPATN